MYIIIIEKKSSKQDLKFYCVRRDKSLKAKEALWMHKNLCNQVTASGAVAKA